MSRFRRKLDAEFPIHVTGRCNNRERFPVPMELAWDILSSYLHLIHGQFQIQIISFVLMPNHFHLLCRDPQMKLPTAMAYLMRESSLEINFQSGRMNRLWGAPYFSSIIGDPKYYLHAYKYTYRNPIAAALSSSVESYPWSSLQILLGERKGLFPMICDDTLFSDIEGTLQWLNTNYSSDQTRAIAKGLKRKSFRIPKNRSTRRPIVDLG